MKIFNSRRLFFTAFTAAFLVFSGCSDTNTISFTAMDTFMTIKAFGKKAESVNKKAKSRVEQLENYFSTTKEGSDLYRVNTSSGEPVKVHEETAFLVSEALKMAYKTDGAFTPSLYPVTKAWGFTTGEYRTPSEQEIEGLLQYTDYKKVRVSNNHIQLEKGMMLDLGAVAKGYTGDQLVKLFRENNIQSSLMDLGGNIVLIGPKPDGSLWRVGLKNPFGGDVLAVLQVKDCSVITSGGTERFFKSSDGNKYIHIFDGNTGHPVNNSVVQSTIICPDGTYGDTLSTTTFILGKEKAIELWRQTKDFQMILVFDDKSICYTAPLKDIIEVNEEFSSVEVIE